MYLSYIFQKRRLREILYRNFRDYNDDNFNRDLQNRPSAESVEEYAPFEKKFPRRFKQTCALKEKSCSCKSCTVYN